MRSRKVSSTDGSITLDLLNKMHEKILNTDFKSPPLIISPKAMDLLLLDVEWKKLGDILYIQRWLKYNLQNKKYPHRKKLPLPE